MPCTWEPLCTRAGHHTASAWEGQRAPQAVAARLSPWASHRRQQPPASHLEDLDAPLFTEPNEDARVGPGAAERADERLHGPRFVILMEGTDGAIEPILSDERAEVI